MTSTIPNWTDDVVGRLKERCADPEKPSAAGIAHALNKEFGTSLNRNAVIGKANRMGLKLGNTRFVSDEPAKPRKPRRPRVQRTNPFNPSKIIPFPPMVTPMSDNTEPVPAGGITFMELTTKNCHFPFGNGPYLFCGQPSVEDKPYCSFHCALAYQPSRYQQARTPFNPFRKAAA